MRFTVAMWWTLNRDLRYCRAREGVHEALNSRPTTTKMSAMVMAGTIYLDAVHCAGTRRQRGTPF